MSWEEAGMGGVAVNCLVRTGMKEATHRDIPGMGTLHCTLATFYHTHALRKFSGNLAIMTIVRALTCFLETWKKNWTTTKAIMIMAIMRRLAGQGTPRSQAWTREGWGRMTGIHLLIKCCSILSEGRREGWRWRRGVSGRQETGTTISKYMTCQTVQTRVIIL